MRPREVTYTFERAVLSHVVAETDPRNPHAVIGQLQLLDLDGEMGPTRHTVSLCYPRREAGLADLAALQSAVYPRADAEGRPTPPPTLRVTVGVELDRSLYLKSWERRPDDERV